MKTAVTPAELPTGETGNIFDRYKLPSSFDSFALTPGPAQRNISQGSAVFKPSNLKTQSNRDDTPFTQSTYPSMMDATPSIEKPLHMLGHQIWYPSNRRPFPPQVALTSKIVTALNKKQNALLESPTGTGKTLALLTSTLCWQKGTIVATAAGTQKFNPIYYCSRTHSQLKQVVKELRNLHPNCTRNMKMVVLGSRTQLCQHKKALHTAKSKDQSINEVCKDLVKTFSCSLYHKASRVATALNQSHIWDIEDALTMASSHKGCAYYGTRNVLEDGPHIILAPYNYLVDPAIRARMNISTEGAIMIFDEGHNLEDVCRSVASAELSSQLLHVAVEQLDTLSSAGSVPFKSLLSLLSQLLRWLVRTGDLLFADNNGDQAFNATQGNGWNHGKNQWKGMEMLDIFEEEFGLNEASLNIYWEHFQTVLAEQEAANERLNGERELSEGDTENELIGMLSGTTITVLESVLNVFRFMLINNRANGNDYNVTVNRTITKLPGRRQQETHTIITFYCMAASVAFRDLSANCHSVLITSGTLSPLDSFAGELGAEFPVRVEAGHVIELSKQIFVAGVGSSYGCSLDSTYRNQQSPDYVRALGDSLLAISQRVCGGILVFFPSYRLLNNMLEAWGDNGTLTNIQECTGSEVFVEPKDSKDMEKMLTKYYAILDGPSESSVTSSASAVQQTSAVMLAVCRGKVSEGINFSDHYARAVIIVGIPFPAVNDTFVRLKRTFQDEKHQENRDVHVSGELWYKQQAFRAINQSIGRCIRHKNDYGAIFLLDPRFHHGNVQENLSRWLRGAVANYDCISETLPGLDSFFAKFGSASSAQMDLDNHNKELKMESEINSTVCSEWKAEDSLMGPLDTSTVYQSPAKSAVVQSTPIIQRTSVQTLNLFACIKAMSMSKMGLLRTTCIPHCYETLLSTLQFGMDTLAAFYSSLAPDGTVVDRSALGPVVNRYHQVDDWTLAEYSSSPFKMSAEKKRLNLSQDIYKKEEWLSDDGCVVRYLLAPRSLLVSCQQSPTKQSPMLLSKASDLVLAVKILAVSSAERSDHLGLCWVLRDVLDISGAPAVTEMAAAPLEANEYITGTLARLRLEYREYYAKSSSAKKAAIDLVSPGSYDDSYFCARTQPDPANTSTIGIENDASKTATFGQTSLGLHTVSSKLNFEGPGSSSLGDCMDTCVSFANDCCSDTVPMPVSLTCSTTILPSFSRSGVSKGSGTTEDSRGLFAQVTQGASSSRKVGRCLESSSSSASSNTSSAVTVFVDDDNDDDDDDDFVVISSRRSNTGSSSSTKRMKSSKK